MPTSSSHGRCYHTIRIYDDDKPVPSTKRIASSTSSTSSNNSNKEHESDRNNQHRSPSPTPSTESDGWSLTHFLFHHALDYLAIDWLGAAIFLHFLGAATYMVEDSIHAFLPSNFFAKRQTQTYLFDIFNLLSACIYAVDSILYRQAFIESRELHRQGHARDGRHTSDLYSPLFSTAPHRIQCTVTIEFDRGTDNAVMCLFDRV